MFVLYDIRIIRYALVRDNEFGLPSVGVEIRPYAFCVKECDTVAHFETSIAPLLGYFNGIEEDPYPV